MKTADLIPLILLELSTGDKYGFELTKAVETKSQGKIVIKQPTLYTLLKKLEKSKFISSYWLDSDIGGKRHYYKLTENGKLQVSTLPSYDTLINIALADENEQTFSFENSESKKVDGNLSIMDSILSKAPQKPIESVLPSEEVFAAPMLDNATSLDISMQNMEVLKDEKDNSPETFAENENISKFTNVAPVSPAPMPKLETRVNVVETIKPADTSKTDIDDIKYVDYINFKRTLEYRQGKMIAKKLLMQALFTSLSVLVLSLMCLLVTNFTGRTSWFYIVFISAGLFSLFCPIAVGFNLDKLRKKYQTTYYNPNIKQKLIVSLVFMLALLIISIIVSIATKYNHSGSLLAAKNFANLFAPTLISCGAPLSVLINYILFKKPTENGK